MRTSNGCWTCRLRRKKCDEIRPECHGCAALGITCHFDTDAKPEWMDGGAKQEEMAETLKTEIKERARRRRGDRIGHSQSDERPCPATATSDVELLLPSRTIPATSDTPLCGFTSDTGNEMKLASETTGPGPRCGTDWMLSRKPTCKIFRTFYLENLLPFLFPFYRPSPFEGGKAWIQELMVGSPVVQHAYNCQSAYFFSLARPPTDQNTVWDDVLTQTTNALSILRHALQVIEDSSVGEHVHGATRILGSIMQMQRFEIAMLSFQNWQSHLDAALAMFEQLLQSATGQERADACFYDVMSRLGPSTSSSWAWSSQNLQIPSAEQASFRFSSSLIVLDDVIAGATLGKPPRLHNHHRYLLGDGGDADNKPIDLETIVGLSNGVLLCIGEIAVLEAWKQQRRLVGDLDVVELAHRATVTKESLVAHLTRLEMDPQPKKASSLFDVFAPPIVESSFVSRVWAHAALIYLSTVVSGWQPASIDVRYHVSRVIELLKWQGSPVVLRAMAWPICVAGCLAEPAQEACLREMVEGLQPASIFGTVHKALEVMEHVWRVREEDVANRTLAMCFRLQGEVILLV